MIASLNRCYGVVVYRADCKDIVAIVTLAIMTLLQKAGKRMNAAGSMHWRNSGQGWWQAPAERVSAGTPAIRAPGAALDET
jgi:hypothetical protein